MSEPAPSNVPAPAADPGCVFCKIVAGRIPARRVYEDDQLLAFHDIQPAAPVHLLVIPKLHLPSLAEAGPQHEALLGRMVLAASRLMAEQGVTNGYRCVVNTGPDGGQEVYHLHLHAMGGPRPWQRG